MNSSKSSAFKINCKDVGEGQNLLPFSIIFEEPRLPQLPWLALLFSGASID